MFFSLAMLLKTFLKRFVVGGMWISRMCRRMMSGYCGFQALGSTVNIKRCWKEFVMVFGGTYGFFETNGCLVTIVLLWRGCLMMSCCVLFIGFDIVAGKLDKDDEGVFKVVYDDHMEGVEFISATLNNTQAADLMDEQGTIKLKELVPCNAVLNLEGLQRPLLSIQITKLKDRLVMGCAFNHAILEAAHF
nr:BAHD acyltransferase DCR [Tanacetum cinerariifolium]